MKVTSLRPLSRRPGFLAVEVDGVRVAVLPVERVRALGLARGQVLSDGAARRLERTGAVEEAYRAAVRLLAVRSRSVQEVLLRLRRKGMPPDAVAEAVGRLETAGVLDDRRFAEEFARGRAARGYGRPRIQADLVARGVDRRVADVAAAVVTDGALSEQEGEARIERLARQRAERLRGLPETTRIRRLAAFLARRGYAGSEAVRLARRVTRGSGEGRDPPVS